MKILAVVAVVIALCAAGLLFLNTSIYNEAEEDGLSEDFKEVTFSISDVSVALENGVARATTPLGDGMESTVRYFGNEVSQDMDGDGAEDVAFLITEETTRGTYFYLVGALSREGGYEGTHAVLIGKDIAPQTTQKGEGRTIIVNYAERTPGASTGRSLYLLLDTETLEFGELVQNFEGESE